MTAFAPPCRLDRGDDLTEFSSGVELVDAWVHGRAHKATDQGTAVVYVSRATDVPAGLYSLSAHSLMRADVHGGWLRRNVPEQIPAVLLGILGVDRRFQGQGLGRSLLRDAILRSRHVSQEVGARALLVDPVEDARPFYLRYGFRELPETSRLSLPLT